MKIGTDLIVIYDILSKEDPDEGHTNEVKHQIALTDPSSFKHRYWRIPPSIYGEVRTHLRQLLDIDIIHPPFSSNLVLVKKKNGSLRLCVDYRQRNLQTKPDYYALLCIKELLDSYVQGTSFSQLLI